MRVMLMCANVYDVAFCGNIKNVARSFSVVAVPAIHRFLGQKPCEYKLEKLLKDFRVLLTLHPFQDKAMLYVYHPRKKDDRNGDG